MRYIFPRQFDLHNVFTSKVDPRETAMPFKDYTLREKEILQAMSKSLGDRATNADAISKWKSRVPKRLRGMPVALVDKLRTLNQRCSYMELLRHYCPVEVCRLHVARMCIDIARAFHYHQNHNGGRIRFSRQETFVQPLGQRNMATRPTPTFPPRERSKKPVSQTWPAPSRMCLHFAVLLHPKSFHKISGVVRAIGTLSCTG